MRTGELARRFVDLSYFRTFELTPDLRSLMDDHPEVNWTAVFREAIRRQARAADVARQILEEESDPRVQAVADLLKRRTGERFRKARGPSKAR